MTKAQEMVLNKHKIYVSLKNSGYHGKQKLLHYETGLKVQMGNAWICKTHGSYNDLHLHGGSIYLELTYFCLDDCGGLVFRNPNDCVHMADNFVKDPCWWGKYTKKVKTGMTIFFSILSSS